MNIKNETVLTGAHSLPWNLPLHTYDDGLGPVWIYSEGHGPRMVVRALSFDKAYEIILDELPPIPQEDLPEAYGYYGAGAEICFQDAVSAATLGIFEYPELVDGYRYQPNATGTGIVELCHEARLRPYDPKVDPERIRLAIRHHDSS